MTHPDDLIEVERRCLSATDNPMHAWAAYSLARAAGAQVPEWVLRYLDMVQRGLLELALEADARGGKDLGPKIAKALRLDGKPGSGSPLANYHKDWLVFGMRVRARMTTPDASGRPELETYAIEAVAEEMGEDTSTVRRGFKLYDSLFPGSAIFPDEALS